MTTVNSGATVNSEATGTSGTDDSGSDMRTALQFSQSTRQAALPVTG